MLPLTLDRDALRAIDPRNVIIVKRPKPLKTKFFRNLLPELGISLCPSCNQCFHSEDFELQVLQKGFCPFCRNSGENLLNSY
jgi:intraflagellar transport protein 122